MNKAALGRLGVVFAFQRYHAAVPRKSDTMPKMDAAKYLVLLRAYIKERGELETLHTVVGNAADYLQAYKTSVSDAEFSISKRYTADASLPSDGWPSLPDLKRAVAVFEESAKAVIEAYNCFQQTRKSWLLHRKTAYLTSLYTMLSQ